MNKNNDNHKTANDIKPVLTDSYFCGVDFGNGKSQGVFTVFNKDGNLVWYTRKMWKAKLYVWLKRFWYYIIITKN